MSGQTPEQDWVPKGRTKPGNGLLKCSRARAKWTVCLRSGTPNRSREYQNMRAYDPMYPHVANGNSGSRKMPRFVTEQLGARAPFNGKNT